MTPTSSALATDSDCGSIAPKESDIGLHPLKGKSLILDACVGASVAIDLVRREEAKRTQLYRYIS